MIHARSKQCMSCSINKMAIGHIRQIRLRVVLSAKLQGQPGRKGDEEAVLWERSLHDSKICRAIAHLIKQYRPGKAEELHVPVRGGYNMFYRLEYSDGTLAAMRIPCKGVVKFPEEKTKYEVATMRYVAANTTIPVPKICVSSRNCSGEPH
ncbi:hypothetical protein C2857_005789 [Epichloe festucae Fl1]|uniref:Aminoglycoside phosphotransferase domain-containing protein n=1 Tax=Epichloe festucae (strain Fl1) TaxID=877507 RepID=A0A7S9KL80_EPIFF|nr:hypothetical protein C2857_005789 [Epichloe festucae Fl1]